MTEVILDVSDVCAWYADSKVLHGVNLHVNRGEIVALMGRNGAGKSTTLKSIMGLIENRSGEYRFKGNDIGKLPLHRVARQGISYVPEDRGIFSSLSVYENLTLPPKVSHSKYDLERIYSLFPNLMARRNSPGTKLSGGEQQMLAIARVLRTGVDMLLLDEPTEGLAPVVVEKIGGVLNELKKDGMTILLVEQNFHFASRHADRFYLLETGRIEDHFAACELAQRMPQMHKVLGV